MKMTRSELPICADMFRHLHHLMQVDMPPPLRLDLRSSEATHAKVLANTPTLHALHSPDSSFLSVRLSICPCFVQMMQALTALCTPSDTPAWSLVDILFGHVPTVPEPSPDLTPFNQHLNDSQVLLQPSPPPPVHPRHFIHPPSHVPAVLYHIAMCCVWLGGRTGRSCGGCSECPSHLSDPWPTRNRCRHTGIQTHTDIHTQTYTHTHTHRHKYTHTDRHTHRNIHTYTHTEIHTHRHTHTHRAASLVIADHSPTGKTTTVVELIQQVVFHLDVLSSLHTHTLLSPDPLPSPACRPSLET